MSQQEYLMERCHLEDDKTTHEIGLALEKIKAFRDNNVACASTSSFKELEEHLREVNFFVQDQAARGENLTIDAHWQRAACKLAKLVGHLMDKYMIQQEQARNKAFPDSWDDIAAQLERHLKHLLLLKELSVPPPPSILVVIPVVEEPRRGSSRLHQLLLLAQRASSSSFLPIVHRIWQPLWGNVKVCATSIAKQTRKLCSIFLRAVHVAWASLVMFLSHLWKDPKVLSLHFVRTILFAIPGTMTSAFMAVGKLTDNEKQEIYLNNFLTNFYCTDQILDVLPRKVLAIVGPAERGSRLAYSLYQAAQSMSDLKALVESRQNTTTMLVLQDIAGKLMGKIPATNENNMQHDLIKEIRDFLKYKRYLIMILDVSTSEDWENIKDAFPDNGYSSRVIITTRQNDVAEDWCSGKQDLIYNVNLMEPPTDDTKEETTRGPDHDLDLEDCSIPLRCCLHYLILYGDQRFERDSMVRKWVSQRIITGEQAAYTVFDELAKLMVIQQGGQGYLYSVHPVARQALKERMICRRDTNNACDVCKLCPSLYVVASSRQIADADLRKSHSITIRGSAKEVLERLYSKQSKCLRVLDLEGCSDVENQDVINICKTMNELRYLSLKGAKVSELPVDIKNLSRLKTLDLRGTQILEKLPRELGDLLDLANLLLAPGVVMPALNEISKQGSDDRIPKPDAASQHLQASCPDSGLTEWPLENPCLVGLETLSVTGRVARIPGWIKEWRFGKITSLAIRVVVLKDDDLEKLGKSMDSLKGLVLVLVGLPTKQIVVNGSTGFAKLEDLALDCHAPWVAFEETAMPRLVRLRLKLYAGPPGKNLSGTCNLPMLRQVTLECSKIYQESDSLKEAEAKVVQESSSSRKLITVYVNGKGYIPMITVPDEALKARFLPLYKSKQLFLHNIYRPLKLRVRRYALDPLTRALYLPGQLRNRVRGLDRAFILGLCFLAVYPAIALLLLALVLSHATLFFRLSYYLIYGIVVQVFRFIFMLVKWAIGLFIILAMIPMLLNYFFGPN